MQITDSQRNDEWYEARMGRATASKFSVIMSGEKYATYKNYLAEVLAERLTGYRNELYQTKEMKWGVDNEPLARLEYQLRSGNEVDECGFYSHESLMVGASPDGLVGTGGLVEFKCPNTATHIETLKKKKVPNQYYWQVQGQLWITGREWCDFVSYDPRLPENASYYCERVYRNDKDIADLESAVRQFLRKLDEEMEFVKNY